MATIAALSVLVDADTSKFQRKMRAVERQTGDAERDTAKLRAEYLKLGAAAGSTAVAIGAATVALGRYAEAGGRSLNVTTAFVRRVGDQERAISLLTSATSGLISEYDLMVQANTAFTLGAAETAEDMALLAEGATKLGRALGLDTTFALESLISGLARGEKEVLDNLGLLVSQAEANRKYAEALGIAESALTDVQRKEAFRAEGLRQLEVQTRELGEVTLNAGDAYRQFVVELGNTNTAFQEQVAQSAGVTAFFTGLAGAVRGAREQMELMNEAGVGAAAGVNLRALDPRFSHIASAPTGPAASTQFFPGRADQSGAEGIRARMEAIRAESEALRAHAEATRNAFLETQTFEHELAMLNLSLEPLPLIVLDASGAVIELGDAAHLTGSQWLPEVDTAAQDATASILAYKGAVEGATAAQSDFGKGAGQLSGILGGLGGLGRFLGFAIPGLGQISGLLSFATGLHNAGAFAEGGTIPAGSFGVVGEKGPEIVTGPATVTPVGGASKIEFVFPDPMSPTDAARDPQIARMFVEVIRHLEAGGFRGATA